MQEQNLQSLYSLAPQTKKQFPGKKLFSLFFVMIFVFYSKSKLSTRQLSSIYCNFSSKTSLLPAHNRYA